MKKTAMMMLAGMMCACVSAGEFLFKDGKSDWQIVISENAAKAEEYAAKELQSNLKEISGAELPIVKTNAVPAEKALVLGSIETTPAVQKEAEKLGLKKSKDDLLALKTVGKNLYFAANTPRAVLFPVYHFLYEEFGARWFWPELKGMNGTFLPKHAAYEVKEMNWFYQPVFRYREMSQCSYHGHWPTELWMVKVGLNMGSQNPGSNYLYVRRAGTHSVGIEGEKIFKEHPEYFSMIDGKRVKDGIAGCWSNPGFTKLMVERLTAMSKNAEILNAFVYDTTMRCQCPECTKNPDVSGRWWEYYSKLVKEVRKVYPDLEAAGLAYQEYSAPPQKPVEGMAYVEYCQYNRCYIHKLDDPNCPVNRKSMEIIREWLAKAPLAIYGYHFDIFNDAHILPCWNMLADECRTYAKMGIMRMKTEMPIPYRSDIKRENLIPQQYRIAYYMYSQLTWNPELKTEDILKDWCHYLYGAGEKPMFEYLTKFAEAWDNMKCHISYFGSEAAGLAGDLMSDELVAFSTAKLAEAEKLAKAQGDTPEAKRALEEIELEKALFQQWIKTWEVSKKNNFSCRIPKFPEGTSFDKVPQVPVSSNRNTHQPTEMRMYWSDEALHIQVVCMDKDIANLRLGEKGKDVPFWNYDSIELFLGFNDGTPYRQMGVCAAGGTYDAFSQDTKWNPEWTAVTKIGKDRWTAEITLPFKSISGVVPKDGDFWRLSVIRNNKGHEACGFYKPVYRDLNLMAKAIFSEK